MNGSADVVGLPSEVIVMVFTAGGIVSLIYAAFVLVRESILSLEVLNTHLDEVMAHDG